jgi:thiamine kinase-like enzyme|tara:strand:+ start:453 stop:1391 length:939 start_codon:yes stop_codon:yes gene_type:complete
LKNIGTHNNDDEKQLEDYLVKITKWDKENILYEPIGGGITNINWRILNKDENKEYFIKVPGLGTEIFIDRKASFEANSLAAKIGLGPMVYDYLSEFGVEIYDFLNDHSTCTNSSFESLETTKKVLDGYKRFHSAGKLSVVKSGTDLVEDHFQQLSEFKCEIPEDFDFLKYNFYIAKEKLLKAGLDLVPCFHDPIAGNFLFSKSGELKMVDFEYSFQGDRYYDLAVFFGEMFFTDEIEDELLNQYFGESDEIIKSKIYIYKAIADIKWASWAFIQDKLSTLDFDFYKYGALKFLRARDFIINNNWSKSLGRIK